jgi:hypothetical protein
MALNADQLDRIDALFNGSAESAAAVKEFRVQFPGVSVTQCDLSDMGAELPFREYPKVSLFLVDRSDHCWRLTSEPAKASGIVIAPHKAGL